MNYILYSLWRHLCASSKMYFYANEYESSELKKMEQYTLPLFLT